MMDRRTFLGRALAAGSLLVVPRGATASAPTMVSGAAAGRSLVLIHLVGGNDGLNTVVPYRDRRYAKLRPALAVASSRVRRLEDGLGLHPALGGLEELWRRERLAIVNGVGYPQPDYSHFRSTEIWYTGRPAEGPVDGWLGRALRVGESIKPLRAVALAKETPLTLRGAGSGVVSLDSFSQLRLSDDVAAVSRLYARRSGESDVERVAARGREALDVADRIARLTPAPGPFYGNLGGELRKALALLASDIDVEVVQLSFGGFDTHAGQAATHAGLLTQLGNNLRAFQDQLDERGLADRVTTVVFSEFGRRPEENLSGGTDHGSAGPVFIVGSKVRPGFHGTQPSLDDLEGGNLRFAVDYRRIYAAVLQHVLGVDPTEVLDVPGSPLELFS